MSQWFLIGQTLLYNFYIAHFHANSRELFENCNFHMPFWPFLLGKNFCASFSRKNFKTFMKMVEENSVNFHTVPWQSQIYVKQNVTKSQNIEYFKSNNGGKFKTRLLIKHSRRKTKTMRHIIHQRTTSEVNVFIEFYPRDLQLMMAKMQNSGKSRTVTT